MAQRKGKVGQGEAGLFRQMALGQGRDGAIILKQTAWGLNGGDGGDIKLTTWGLRRYKLLRNNIGGTALEVGGYLMIQL